MRGRRIGLNLLFPPRCVCCDADLPGLEDDLLLCSACRDVLGPVEWPSCQRCGATKPADAPPPESCGWCRAARLQFDRVVVLGAYGGKLREAVLKMKRPGSEPLSAAMGRVYNNYRGDLVASLRPDVIVPIPMHWSRRLARGTNSPDILADCLARYLRVPLAAGLLSRCRNTLPQNNLSPTKRFRNVR
ncbi:unnamed protein product, partial [marine sediment metagenome]